MEKHRTNTHITRGPYETPVAEYANALAQAPGVYSAHIPVCYWFLSAVVSVCWGRSVADGLHEFQAKVSRNTKFTFLFPGGSSSAGNQDVSFMLFPFLSMMYYGPDLCARECDVISLTPPRLFEVFSFHRAKTSIQRGKLIFRVCMTESGVTLGPAHVHAIPCSFEK